MPTVWKKGDEERRRQVGITLRKIEAKKGRPLILSKIGGTREKQKAKKRWMN